MNQRAYGALLSYASIFINMGIALAFTPFLVSSLGKSEFGLFNIIGSFTAYLIVLDMGMNDSVIRYLLKYKGKGDKKSEKNFLANTFIFYFFLAFLILILGGWLYLSIESLFSNTLSLIEINSLKTMTIIIVANAFLTILFNPVGGYIIANQRFVFLTFSTIILRILTTMVLIIFLYLEYKAVVVVAITAFLNVILLIIKVIYAYKKLDMRVRLYSFDLSEITKLLKYSAPIFIVVLTELIYWKLDNILLGNMIGAIVVGIYAIGMMFHKYFMSFSTAISKVMMPKIILDIDKGADALKMENILTSISRIQGMVIMLILSGIILYGKFFIILWIGIDYIDAYYVMLFTLIPYSLELMGNVRNIFLQVNHLYWYRAMVIFLIAIVNIGVTIYAIGKWGMLGAAGSTGIAIVLGYSAVNYILWVKLKINIVRYLVNVFKGLLPALIMGLTIGKLFSADTINSWLNLIIHISVYTLCYMLLVYFIGMNSDEKKKLYHLVKSLNNKIRGDKNVI